MARDEFDALGIPSQCRQPDPLACYERQSSHEQSDAEPCLCCPVASWINVMVLSGRWTNASVDVDEPLMPSPWPEANALERVSERIDLIEEAILKVAA